MALLLLAAVTPTALSVLAFNEIMRSYMHDRSVYDGRSLGRILATCLSGRVTSGGSQTDRVLMDYLAADDTVAFICVTDADGRPVHMSVHESAAWDTFAATQQGSLASGTIDLQRAIALHTLGDSLFVRTVPIYGPDGDEPAQPGAEELPEGFVVLGLHDVPFFAAGKRYQLMQVMIAVGVAIGLVPLIMLAYSRWTQALRQVRGNVLRLADGEAPLPIDARGDDEIGRLVRAMDFMAGSVLAAQQQLRDTNTNLEGMVQQRTIELREAVRELEQLSTTDVLTGLANRRAFYHHLEDDFARAASYHRDLCIVMIDLDGFKQVNDTLGHDVGDEVLITVAEAIMSETDSTMTAARLGGDEFVVIMREQPASTCCQRAERMSAAFASLLAQRMAKFDGPPPVSMSMGLASVHEAKPASGEELMAMADMALYRAKALGRSRLVMFDKTMSHGGSHAGEHGPSTSANPGRSEAA